MRLIVSLILTIQFCSSFTWAASCINLFKEKLVSTVTPLPPAETPVPKKSQQGYLAIENQKMYYRLEVPDGIIRKAKDEVHLLIHGLLANSSYLDGVAEQLLAQGKTVLRVDLFGHGRSLLNSAEPSGTIHEQAVAISHILNNLRISNLTIYGHSLGGGVALQTVVTAPQMLRGRIKINRLIIDEPYVYPVDKWMVEQSGSNMTGAQAFNPFTYVDFILGAAAGTDSARGSMMQGMVQAIRKYPKYFALTELSPEDQAKGALAVFPTEDLRPIAAQINIPVTLIRGRFGAMVAPKSLMDAIPNFFGHTIKVREVKSPDPHHQPFHSPEPIADVILDPS